MVHSVDMTDAPTEGKGARRRRSIAKHQRGRCFLCGRKLDFDLLQPHPMAPSLHHFIPIGRGGPSRTALNHVIAHTRCNQAQGREMPTPWQWMKYVLVMWRRGLVRWR